MFRRIRRHHLTYVAIALLAGCEEQCGECTKDPTDPSSCGQADETFSVRIWSGDDQVAARGSQLRDRIAVFVGKGSGPDEARSVHFEIEQGGGRLIGAISSGATVTTATDANGVADVRWELGTESVVQQVKVTFPDKPNFLRFRAFGYGRTAVLEKVGDGQTGAAFDTLTNRLALKITDQGVAIPGMRVWFIPQGGGTPEDGVVSTTGLSGVATMTAPWTLGGAAGAQQLLARILDGPIGALNADLGPANPATFTATATTTGRRVGRNPSNFPEPQSGLAGQPAPRVPSVLVTDATFHPLAGVRVRFAITSGGGTLGGLLVLHESVTDATGVITAPGWVLGSPGANIVTVTVLDAQGDAATGVAGNPVIFTTNVAAAPGQLTLVKDPTGDNQSAVINHTVANPPRVRVIDALGRGVGGITIAWAVTQGAGQFQVENATTTPDGYVALTSFSPTVVGTTTLRASTTDTRVTPSSVTFTITGLPQP